MSMQLAAVVAGKVAAKALQSLSSTPPVRYVSYILGNSSGNTGDDGDSTTSQTNAEALPVNGHTVRLGNVSVLRQAVAWLLPPAVVYTGQARICGAANKAVLREAALSSSACGPALLGPTLSVGSACNAVYAGNRYDLIINCCPSEVQIPNTTVQSTRRSCTSAATTTTAETAELDSTTTCPEVIEVNLEDTNDAQLDIDEMVRVIGRAQHTWNRNGHILVNCWMGASRSVAVTCVLMCCLDRCINPTHCATNTTNTAAAAEEAFNRAYGQCVRARPTVNMSNQLCAEVKRVLVALF